MARAGHGEWQSRPGTRRSPAAWSGCPPSRGAQPDARPQPAVAWPELWLALLVQPPEKYYTLQADEQDWCSRRVNLFYTHFTNWTKWSDHISLNFLLSPHYLCNSCLNIYC